MYNNINATLVASNVEGPYKGEATIFKLSEPVDVDPLEVLSALLNGFPTADPSDLIDDGFTLKSDHVVTIETEGVTGVFICSPEGKLAHPADAARYHDDPSARRAAEEGATPEAILSYIGITVV